VKDFYRRPLGWVLQKVAVLFLVVMCTLILHKGAVDISGLAAKHSGKEFWVALTRYLIGNLGGGGKRAD
jgi:hypothetical protein